MATPGSEKTFAVLITTEDPLTAELLVEVLRGAEIDAFVRPRGAAAAGFEAASPGYWELFVPEESVSKATPLIQAQLAALEAEGDKNARAAEEEAMSGENPVAEG